jgi:hypothetical protein
MAFFQRDSPSTFTAIKHGATFINHESRCSEIPRDQYIVVGNRIWVHDVILLAQVSADGVSVDTL